MKGSVFPAILAALALSASTAVAADPTALNCESNVMAVGVSSAAEGGRDFERYKGQVPPGLARKRAIDNWQAQVSSACPRHSAKWWRARGIGVACEGVKSREYCTATAQPARKLLSFLFGS